MHKINWKALIISLVIPVVLIGGGSALSTMNSMKLYGGLERPPLSPPGWVFPVVWTILFVLMGIASYLVWESGSPKRTSALSVYGVQLAVNFLWTLVFFNMQAYWTAFVILLVLWILVAVNVALFWRINKAAGWLLVPYLLWLTFAAYLNVGVAMLN